MNQKKVLLKRASTLLLSHLAPQHTGPVDLVSFQEELDQALQASESAEASINVDLVQPKDMNIKVYRDNLFEKLAKHLGYQVTYRRGSFNNSRDGFNMARILLMHFDTKVKFNNSVYDPKDEEFNTYFNNNNVQKKDLTYKMLTLACNQLKASSLDSLKLAETLRDINLKQAASEPKKGNVYNSAKQLRFILMNLDSKFLIKSDTDSTKDIKGIKTLIINPEIVQNVQNPSKKAVDPPSTYPFFKSVTDSFWYRLGQLSGSTSKSSGPSKNGKNPDLSIYLHNTEENETDMHLDPEGPSFYDQFSPDSQDALKDINSRNFFPSTEGFWNKLKNAVIAVVRIRGPIGESNVNKRKHTDDHGKHISKAHRIE